MIELVACLMYFSFYDMQEYYCQYNNYSIHTYTTDIIIQPKRIIIQPLSQAHPLNKTHLNKIGNINMLPSESTSSINSSTDNNANHNPISRLTLKFRQKISKILFTNNHFICIAQSKIIVHCLTTNKNINIKVCTDDFVVLDFPPYIFACLITQFIYLYTEQALYDVTKIIKMKISKLNVKAICRFNKGYFMGGFNRSPFPGGKLTDKRSIYFMQNLSAQNKNKPLWQITIPKNNNPITILQSQNPYLLCYCSPNIYLLNPFTKQVLLSFQKQFLTLTLLQGRYSFNCLNMIGISYKEHALIGVDVEKQPIYGVQLNQYQLKGVAVCQSREGKIYIGYQNQIFQYNIVKKQKKILKMYQKHKQIVQILISPKNVLIALIKSIQNTNQQQNQQLSPQKSQLQLAKSLQLMKSLSYGQISNGQKQKQKDLNFNHQVIVSNQHNIERQSQKIVVEERRYIQVFAL